MAKKKKHSSRISVSASAQRKRIAGKVDVRMEMRQWLLWVVLAAALICMWVYIVSEQSPSPVDVGEPVDGAIEEARGGASTGEAMHETDAADPVPESTPYPVQINRAGVEQLQHLPGIGPAKALAIVQHRMLHGLFESKEDLQQVKGIGPKTLEKLQDLISVE